MNGAKGEVETFNEWAKRLLNVPLKTVEKPEKGSKEKEAKTPDILENIENRKFKHCICIAGNNETTFEVAYYNSRGGGNR